MYYNAYASHTSSRTNRKRLYHIMKSLQSGTSRKLKKMFGRQTGSAASCPIDAISQIEVVFSFEW